MSLSYYNENDKKTAAMFIRAFVDSDSQENLHQNYIRILPRERCVKAMNKEELAAKLNGSEYPLSVSMDLHDEAEDFANQLANEAAWHDPYFDNRA